MSNNKQEDHRISRRNFIIGVGAGAVVAAVAVAGAESMMLIKPSPSTATVTSTVTGGTATKTTTVTGPTTTVTGPTSTVTTTTTVTATPAAGATVPVTLSVNGVPYYVNVLPNRTLQDVLHDQMGFTSVKAMCTGKGACGSCAVIVDGRAIISCMALAVALDASAGHTIWTAEGIAASGHPITQAWADADAMQCGYCSPGAVVTAKALLDSNPSPTSAQVMQALSGNLCVCGTYQYWPTAVLAAAKTLKGGS